MYEISNSVGDIRQYDGVMNTNEANIYVRKVIGANAGRLRSERRISQSELARMLEVNRSHINQFEAGKQNVSIDYLVKIADGLDVSVVEFFSGLGGASPRRIVEKEE